MPPEFIGAIIALFSALVTFLLVEFLSARRVMRQRAQDQIELSRKEFREIMKPRYEQAASLAGRVNQEILEIIERFNIAERSRHELEQTFIENIASLKGRLVDKSALQNNNQLRSVIQTIGDEELVDAAEELIGNYNRLIGWIEKRTKPHPSDIQFTIEDTQVIESARSESLFYYGRITKRLDALRNGVWILKEEDVTKRG
ncbi:MAG: hypothetical protein JSW42_07915 [Chloroflexota bacterium]|nr:MAG: hypothetical protein JSW42_07915 [Chloroflexota bacterium]